MNTVAAVKRPPPPSLLALLRPYAGWVTMLVALTILANGLNLDRAQADRRRPSMPTTPATSTPLALAVEFFLAAAGVFVFTYLQSVVQTFASEKVARDLRSRLIAKISLHDYAFIQEVSPAKLLTNLTSDIDAIKNFVSQAIASIISSLFLIVGASVLLLMINWQLALVVLLVIPIIGGTFFFVLTRVRKLFRKVQEAIDWLNKVINESIVGAALIRLLNSQQFEFDKFVAANDRGAQHRLRHPAAVLGADPGHHLRGQPRDADDPGARRPFRHRRADEPRRFHRLQLLSRDPDLPDHHHRLHEQRHRPGAGELRPRLAGAGRAGAQGGGHDPARRSAATSPSPTSPSSMAKGRA